MRIPSWLRSLKILFAAGVALLLGVVGTPFFYLFFTLHRDGSLDTLRQATTEMSRLAVQVIEQSMFERAPHTMSPALAEAANAELARRVLVMDKTGRVVASTDPRLVGERLSREGPSCRACHQSPPAVRAAATIVTDEGGVEVFRTMKRVENRPSCYGCHRPTDHVLGVVMLDYPTAAVHRRLRADMLQMFVLALVMFPLTLAVIAGLMNGLVARRVETLVQATNRVRGGDLTVTAPAEGGDELALLGESFNEMTATLRASIGETERQRRYLEHVLDSIEEQICVIDASLCLVTANRSFVAASGFGKDALIGQPCASSGSREPLCEACTAEAVFARGTVQKTHFVAPDREGRDRQYEIFCSPMRDQSGRVSQVIEVRRDVTERAILEANLRQSERLASLGLLASGISHEINNPLASIAACVDGLRRQVRAGGGDTPEGRKAILEDLDLVIRETMRTKAITGRLLILARPSTGLVSLVDLNLQVLETISLLRFEAETVGVTLTTELEDRLPPLVADEGQVRQLLLNLVINAIQAATKAGRPSGRVSITTSTTDTILKLVVADNGAGIEPGDAKKIFEPFYSSRPEGKGTGLGLFIVQTIVRALKGTVEASSRSAEGATFVVEIPIHVAPS